MNLRSLNSFAGGMSRGLGQGSEMANRRKLVGLQEQEGARADKRLGFQEQALTDQREFNKGLLELLRKDAPTVADTVMQTATLEKQAMPQATPYTAAPSVQFPSTLQPLQRMAMPQQRRMLPDTPPFWPDAVAGY